MVDKLNGWAVGDNGLVTHTDDGQNWFEQTNPDTQERTMTYVFFLNINEGWIVGNRGLVLHTTNGGTTWTIEAEGQTTNFLCGISAPTSDCVYICGHKGTFLKYIGEQ
jgi:photosystem II stability/assembly factor-like uncharacterized protein